MKKRVGDYIIHHDLLQAGTNVLVGVSGGADSVCLLLLLCDFVCAKGGRVYAVHVNHCIRGDEACEDQHFVEKLCEKLGVPLAVETVDVPALAARTGMSLEEAGRDVRYSVFVREARRFGCAAVAVAHHRDDAVETVIMNMMRGSGVEGLAGLRPKRKLKTELMLIRPLLEVSKAEIMEWLRSEGQDWREDSTNAETDVTRNRIRLELIPLMEQIRQGSADGILRMSGLAAECAGYMAEQGDEAFAVALIEKRAGDVPGEEAAETLTDGRINDEPDVVVLSVPKLRDTHEALLPYVIKTAIAGARGHVQDITAKHVDIVKALIFRDGPAENHLPDIVVRRRGDELVFEPASGEDKRRDRNYGTEIFQNEDIPTVKCSVHDVSEADLFPENSYTIVCDYDKITRTAELRRRRQGDYLDLAGGGTKLLRRWFIDEKIPRENRDKYYVVADGSRIIWIVGKRFNDFYKVSPATKKILVVTLTHEGTEGESIE